MLRFHIFKKLTLKNLVLVDKMGTEIPLATCPQSKRRDIIYSDTIIGFFFNFSDKFHPTARAYFCKLHDIAPRWRHCCRLRALRMLWTSGLLGSSSLSANVLKPANLIAAMQYIAKNDHTFKTQSLRVGGHTFYITFGLAQDFTNFLGRRAICKSITALL